MARRYRRRLSYSAPALLAVVVLAALRWFFGEPVPPPPANLPEGNYRVERMVDGDTLLVDGLGRVRLMGINSPESVKPDSPVEPWGPEASAFTKQFSGPGPGAACSSTASASTSMAAPWPTPGSETSCSTKRSFAPAWRGPRCSTTTRRP